MELARPNQRQHPRLPLPTPQRATVTIGGQPYAATLRDYSLQGFGVKVEGGAIKRLKRESAEAEVTVHDHTFRGVVRHARAEENSGFVGFKTIGPAQAEGISFTNDDPGWDLIEDVETITNLFNDLAFKGPEVLIEVRQPSGSAMVFVKSVSEAGVLELEIQEMKRGTLNTTAAAFRFEIFQTSHAFEAKIEKVADKTFSVLLPKKVARLLRRETFRVRNGTYGMTLTVELSSRLLGTPTAPIVLWDFSEHGISILDPAGWASAPRGVLLDKVAIRKPNGQELKGSGVICGHRWESEANGYVVGLSFETDSYDNRTRWHDTILEARYPSLSFSYSDEDHPKIWDLFDRSKYLDLKPRESFNQVFDITKHTWERMSRAGTSNCRRVLLRNEEQVVGHLQLDRMYPKTWCAHALAIDPKQSKTIGRDIYSVTTDVLSAESAGYVISITESSLKWNQRNYYEFVKHYRWPDHNQLKLYQIHEAVSNAGWSLKSDPELTVRWASRWDLKRIPRFFELNLPEIEREALGYDEENLTFDTLDRDFKPWGLGRSRRFVVAYRGQDLVGFAALETGTTGLSIFGIQDTVYTFVTPQTAQDPARRRTIQESLLAIALDWYRDQGHPTVNIYFDDIEKEYWAERGLKFIWEGARWIGKGAAARRYHAFTQMMFGHLLLQRGRVRQDRSAISGVTGCA